jgi:hypothetical protein
MARFVHLARAGAAEKNGKNEAAMIAKEFASLPWRYAGAG